MDINDLPGNSYSEKWVEEPEKKEEVVESKPVGAAGSGVAVRRKRSFAKKLVDAFIVADPKEVKRSVINEYIIPGICDLVTDAITAAASMLLQDGVPSRPPRRSGSNKSSGGSVQSGSYKAYNQMSNNPPKRRTTTDRINSGFDDILFDTYDKANECLDRMKANVNKYGNLSIGDYYDIASEVTGVPISRTGWTDNDWGWEELSGAYVYRSRHRIEIDGRRDYRWLIWLPKPTEID